MQEHLGQFSKTPEGFQVIFERKIPYPPEFVWWTLTDPDRLRIWFTDVKMDFFPGGDLVFLFRDKNRMEISGQILQIEYGKLFEYSLKGEVSRWEIEPEEEDCCKLTFTYSKVAPQYLLTIAIGWHIYLEQLIAVLIGRTKPFPFSGTRETKQAKALKTIYSKILLEQFPEDFEPPKTIKALVTQRTFYASVEEVWDAIVNPEKIKKWFFEIPNFQPEPDFEFEFSAGPNPENQYLHRCKIIAVVPFRRLSYTWNYSGYSGTSVVTFGLYPKEGGKTLVILTHRGLETFPSSNPDFAVEKFAEGWKYILSTSLKNFLEKWRFN